MAAPCSRCPHVEAPAVQALYKRFATFDDQSVHKGSATRQILRLLPKAAVMRIRPDAPTLNAICAYMIALGQQSAAERLSARSIAIMLQAFSQMRYLPEPPHIAHLLEQFAILCTMSPPLQPGPEDIRHVFAAMGRLGSTESSQVVRDIGVQVMNTASTGEHTLCTVVRNMAARDVLDLDMFVHFLDIFRIQSGNIVRQAHLRQISQVMYKLEPLPQDSRAMHLWEGVRVRVQALGCLQTRHVDSSYFLGCEPLCRSLAQLQLVHRRFVELSAYKVEAVLDQKSPRSGPLLLVVIYHMDKLMNKPDRYALQKCRVLHAMAVTHCWTVTACNLSMALTDTSCRADVNDVCTGHSESSSSNLHT